MHLTTARHVKYAGGYTALGLFKDAAAELESIAADDREQAEVLLAWVELRWETKEWERMVMAARRLVEQDPARERGWIAWAFALRELGQVAEAKRVLLEAEPRHGGTSAVLHYNLGCYHCLLGELADARARLAVAFKMHPPFREDALEDRDLESLWSELKTP